MTGSVGLTAHQAQVASRFLTAAHTEREPLVVALSGAHAYGFPSPDSDLDLKAIHIAPTRALLGLRADCPPIEHTEIVEGVELDYSSHELGMVLGGVLKGNGNFIERVLGHLLLTGELVTNLQDLAPTYGFAIDDLLEAKSHSEKQALDALGFDDAVVQMDRAFGILEAAHDRSILPAEARNAHELDAWLVETRLARC